MPLEIVPKHPMQTWQSYQFSIVNNFFLHFPLGREPFNRAMYPDVGYYLGLHLEHGNADIPFDEYSCSKLKASKTPRQFIQELWDITALSGIDMPALSRKLFEQGLPLLLQSFMNFFNRSEGSSILECSDFLCFWQ